jgi:thymidylate synthase (FAD)
MYLGELANGVPAEDARYLLPGATKTELVATFNMRMWRHVIRERFLNPHAQWEIRQVMLTALTALYWYLPVLFEDIVQEGKKLNEHQM